MANHDRPTDIAVAYAAAHERTVRLAYAVAGWAEDYPLPVGVAPDWRHVATLQDAVRRLSTLCEILRIPEQPPRGAQPEEA